MSKTYTVVMQFDAERAYSAGRSEFMRYFTDVIRQINATPKLGKLRYAAVMQADTMASLSRMDAGAYGPPQASAPQTFTICTPCKNSQWCRDQGRCEIAHRALAEAEAAVLAKRVTAHGSITGRLPPMITEDFLPEPPTRPVMSPNEYASRTPTERKRKVVKAPEPEPSKPAKRGPKAPAHRGAKPQARNKAAAGKGKAGGNRRAASKR